MTVITTWVQDTLATRLAARRSGCHALVALGLDQGDPVLREGRRNP
jgi:hypothetical protein